MYQYERAPMVQPEDDDTTAPAPDALDVALGAVAQPDIFEEQQTVEDLPSGAHESDFMTTLFSRDEEALNLEPIEVVDKKNKAKRRKRKLVVDKVTMLVNEQIKAQINNDEDIIKTAVVAPPTRARYKLLC